MANAHVIIVVGLGFGDEGKGTTIDYLARVHNARVVVRFNGGAQAGHNVVAGDGRHHTFAQFGSATFIPGVRTHLSRFMLVNPLSMLREEAHLRALGITDAFDRTTLDGQASIVTPFHRAANRLLELARGPDRRGSCGMGIGQALDDGLTYGEEVMRARDLSHPGVMRVKLKRTQERQRAAVATIRSALPPDDRVAQELWILEASDVIDECLQYYTHVGRRVAVVDEACLTMLLNTEGTILFEGGQGVLLDCEFGFIPHTTPTKATFDNALTLLGESCYRGALTRLGVLRAYATRHGAGPFVTEDAALGAVLPEPHNAYTPWQDAFRGGHFDLVATRYALEAVGGVDAIALTNIDRVAELTEMKLCWAYDVPAHAEKFFGFRAGSSFRMHCITPPDRTHQEALTQLLRTAKPLYEGRSPPRSHDEVWRFVGDLEEKLECRITMLSLGPTAQDKVVLA